MEKLLSGSANQYKVALSPTSQHQFQRQRTQALDEIALEIARLLEDPNSDVSRQLASDLSAGLYGNGSAFCRVRYAVWLYRYPQYFQDLVDKGRGIDQKALPRYICQHTTKIFVQKFYYWTRGVIMEFTLEPENCCTIS